VNQIQYILIRTVIRCAYSPRRLRLKKDEILFLRDALMKHWLNWQHSLDEMRKTERLLKKMIESDKLGYQTKRLAVNQLTRLTAITDEAYEA